MRKRSIAVILPLLILLAACNSWEKTTFQTLAASKATIDQAGADYNAKKIPNTQAAFTAITKAREAQTGAVNAFHAYAVAKITYNNSKLPGDKTALDASIAGVNAALAALPDVLTELRSLEGAK